MKKSKSIQKRLAYLDSFGYVPLSKKKATSKSTRGGVREGAGPPTLFDEPMKRVAVILDGGTITKAKSIGDGNLSAGIREAVRRVRKP